MVLGIQLIGLLFGAAVLYVSFLNYKRREFTLNEFGFWSIFAIIFTLLALFPDRLDPVIATLSLSRAMDLFVILGFMFLVGGLLYVYRVLRHVQKSHTELVRKLALERKK